MHRLSEKIERFGKRVKCVSTPGMFDRVSGLGQEVLIEGGWRWVRQNVDATSITRQAGQHMIGHF